MTRELPGSEPQWAFVTSILQSKTSLHTLSGIMPLWRYFILIKYQAGSMVPGIIKTVHSVFMTQKRRHKLFTAFLMLINWEQNPFQFTRTAAGWFGSALQKAFTRSMKQKKNSVY